jgi:hypothetical protein
VACHFVPDCTRNRTHRRSPSVNETNQRRSWSRYLCLGPSQAGDDPWSITRPRPLGHEPPPAYPFAVARSSETEPSSAPDAEVAGPDAHAISSPHRRLVNAATKANARYHGRILAAMANTPATVATGRSPSTDSDILIAFRPHRAGRGCHPLRSLSRVCTRPARRLARSSFRSRSERTNSRRSDRSSML